MHVVCGNVYDVSIDENNLVVNVQEDYSYNFIVEGNNINIIERALKWQDLNLNLKILKQEKTIDKKYQDIEKLNKLVDNEYLIIKGD